MTCSAEVLLISAGRRKGGGNKDSNNPIITQAHPGFQTTAILLDLDFKDGGGAGEG